MTEPQLTDDVREFTKRLFTNRHEPNFAGLPQRRPKPKPQPDEEDDE